jgi:hypothetical protein
MTTNDVALMSGDRWNAPRYVNEVSVE